MIDDQNATSYVVRCSVFRLKGTAGSRVALKSQLSEQPTLPIYRMFYFLKLAGSCVLNFTSLLLTTKWDKLLSATCGNQHCQCARTGFEPGAFGCFEAASRLGPSAPPSWSSWSPSRGWRWAWNIWIGVKDHEVGGSFEMSWVTMTTKETHLGLSADISYWIRSNI